MDSVQYLALAPGFEMQRPEAVQEFRAVNLSTGQAQDSFEVTVFDHQDAAITLSSLEQVRPFSIRKRANNISNIQVTASQDVSQYLTLQQF